jgi:hypothetical protein
MLLDSGVSHVRFRSPRVDGRPPPSTCELCDDADGVQMPTEEALRLRLLPHRDCTCEGGCRCVYLPVQ